MARTLTVPLVLLTASILGTNEVDGHFLRPRHQDAKWGTCRALCGVGGDGSGTRKGARHITHQKRMLTWAADEKYDLSARTYHDFDGGFNK